MSKTIKIILAICLLILAGCTQVSTPPEQIITEPEIYPSQLKGTTKDDPANPDWLIYQNNDINFSMRYPKNWIFDEFNDGNMLDIHLSNITASDGPQCQKDFIGIELQIGSSKDENQDFESFLKSQLDTGLGAPSGELQKLQLGENTVFQSEGSGWDAGCMGRGYMIEQEQTNYIYIFTGSDEMNQKGTEPKVIQDIITSIHIGKS